MAGLQDSISWKSVGIGAIAGGVGAGLGTISQLSNSALGAVGGGLVRGALGNAITQGLSVATGLQDRFDWTGVAVGAVAGGVAGGVGSLLAKAGISGASTSAGGIANSLISGGL